MPYSLDRLFWRARVVDVEDARSAYRIFSRGVLQLFSHFGTVRIFHRLHAHESLDSPFTIVVEQSPRGAQTGAVSVSPIFEIQSTAESRKSQAWQGKAYDLRLWIHLCL